MTNKTFERYGTTWTIHKSESLHPNAPSLITHIAYHQNPRRGLIVSAFTGGMNGEYVPKDTGGAGNFVVRQAIKTSTEEIKQHLHESAMKRMIDDVHPLVGKLNVAMGRETHATHEYDPRGRSVITFKKENPKDAAKIAAHLQNIPGSFRSYKRSNREFDPTYYEITHD